MLGWSGEVETRSIRIQGKGSLEVFTDHLSKFWRLDHGYPARPAKEPMNDFVESIDAKIESDGSVLVTLNSLGWVPESFGHEVGGFTGESDFDVVGLSTTVDPPGIAEVCLEVEVRRDHGRGVEGPEGFEPSDPVSSGMYRSFGPGDEIPSLLYEAKAVGMYIHTFRFGIVGAGIGAGQLLALD